LQGLAGVGVPREEVQAGGQAADAVDEQGEVQARPPGQQVSWRDPGPGQQAVERGVPAPGVRDCPAVEVQGAAPPAEKLMGGPPSPLIVMPGERKGNDGARCDGCGWSAFTRKKTR
jgi:hypothetical protein